MEAPEVEKSHDVVDCNHAGTRNRNRNRNLKISKALFKSKAHQGTSLFTSAATNQREVCKGGQEKLRSNFQNTRRKKKITRMKKKIMGMKKWEEKKMKKKKRMGKRMMMMIIKVTMTMMMAIKKTMMTILIIMIIILTMMALVIIQFIQSLRRIESMQIGLFSILQSPKCTWHLI